MRRPALTARSTCSRPWVSTRPPGSKTRIFRRCGYSAARRPRLSHMLPMTPSISGSESPGKARLMLRRACRVTGRRGPMARPSAPPKADAQSSGKTLNTLNKNATPQATSRSATLGVLVERFGAAVLSRVINCAIQVGIRFRRRRLSRSLCLPLRCLRGARIARREGGVPDLETRATEAHFARVRAGRMESVETSSLSPQLAARPEAD